MTAVTTRADTLLVRVAECTDSTLPTTFACLQLVTGENSVAHFDLKGKYERRVTLADLDFEFANQFTIFLEVQPAHLGLTKCVTYIVILLNKL